VQVETAHAAPPGWDGLVTADERATFFHTAQWAGLTAGPRKRSEALFLFVRDGGELAGGIPAVVGRRGPFRVVSSMPHGTYGALVLRPGASPEVSSALLGVAADIARAPATAALHLVDLAGRLPGSHIGFDAHTERAHVISLDRPYEDVWASFSPSARNKVRKARRSGVTIRRAVCERDFLAYHAMLVQCSQRWRRRCTFGPDFFTRLAAAAPSRVQMWLAELDGRVIGGDLNFVMNGRIMNWGNVSRAEGRALGANSALHAFAIENGVEQSCRVYDLGSSAGIEGVDAFKAAFGTRLVAYTRFSAEKPWFRALRRAARTARESRE
jgi:hypothetical protein